MNDNLFDAFVETASARLEKPALFWSRQHHSYGQFLAQSAWVAHRLREKLGIQPGDRVAIWMRNRPEFVPALLGILAAGAVAVPVNNFLKAGEVAYMLADAGVRVVIAEDSAGDSMVALEALQPGLQTLRAEEIPSVPAALEWTGVARCHSDLAVLIYTSGTTGKPKGAMLTHGNLLHNVESCRQILQVVDIDRIVVLLPMFHSFMLTVGILLPLLVGGSIVLIQSLNSPKALIEELVGNSGTVLPAMAQIFRALAGLPPGVELPLRLCVSGAGPLPMEILKAFNARHPNVPLIEGYGLSEASPVVSVNPVRGPWIAGTIGLPIPNVEMCVQDDAGQFLPDGVDGEICVRGGNIMAGYWNAPEKTAETVIQGWLHTGDIGHRRSDGYYVITDRKKDMLKPNGINVYPREIEEVIYQFPGIKECAVVGEPDERRGERPVAFVALDDGVVFEERALLTFLKERLADYKLPRRAVRLTALPRNATGKILKTSLRELLMKDSAA